MNSGIDTTIWRDVVFFRFYEVNNVNKFQFSRPFHKGEKDKDNEFKVSF